MKRFHLDPNSFEQIASDRTEWKHLVPTSTSRFASAYEAAVIARRTRRHNPPTDGTHLCNVCERIFLSLADLRKDLGAHQRRRMANEARTVGEDVFIETDGHP